MSDGSASSARRYGLGFVVAVSVVAAGLGAVVTRAASAEASGACADPASSAPGVQSLEPSAELVAPRAVEGPAGRVEAALLDTALLEAAPLEAPRNGGAHDDEEPVLTDEAAELAAARPAVEAGVRVAKFEHENFLAELRTKPSYAAGKEETLSVVVTVKGEFKINPQFPVKFKLGEPAEGVRYPKPLLKREDGKFEDKSGSFEVPFVVDKAGRAAIGGTLSLSVCSDKRCIMEKVALDTEIDVQ